MLSSSSHMMMLSQALRHTCSFGSTSDPIAYTLYSLLLAAVADGGGEEIGGGVSLRVSSSGLASRLGVSAKRLHMSLELLQECQLIKFQDKRRGNLRLSEIVIPYSETDDKDEPANDMAAKPCHAGGVHGRISPPYTKKKNETKEESSPHTPLIEERKDKKKERLGEEEKKKNACETLKERRAKFWESLVPFGDRYGSETLQSFYAHWIKRDRATGIMDFESDPKFELEVALHEWHLNRQLFKKGSGRRGSVAAEVSAEHERQQKRIRDQEASLKVVRERERLLAVLQVVPPVFIQMLKREGKDLSGIKADEVFTVLGLRYENKTLTTEQAEAYEYWKKRRDITEEALRRMESG